MTTNKKFELWMILQHLTWCVVKKNFADEKVLQANIDYACSKVDCGPIQPGGSCFLPNTLKSHASFAMNSFFQSNFGIRVSCQFNKSGVIVTKDPSNTDSFIFTFILILDHLIVVDFDLGCLLFCRLW